MADDQASRAQREYQWFCRSDLGKINSDVRAALGAAPSCPTAATMLIDHSGSMRSKVEIANTLAAYFVEFARSWGIRFEVLGFTTRFWRGSPVREEWIEAGSPEGPGRLCALRHIVYSAFDDDAPPYMGAMFRRRLLKENIDGEALEWAAARLLSPYAERRVLFIVSDGAPVDDSTLAANPGDYLFNHLKEVVARLQEERQIALYGVGICHDVRPVYPFACSVSALSEVREVARRFLRDALAPVET
ncbi:MAG: hypothetical protein IID49_06995 [Proteobacteria bacterium]|nr:hypothetical protein [Pseudomonadota bacterium]